MSGSQINGDVSIRTGNAQNPSCVAVPIGNDSTCVLCGRTPDTTPTTTLFFSEPRMTVSALPSQRTSATRVGLLIHFTVGCVFRSSLRASVLDTCAVASDRKMAHAKITLWDLTSALYSQRGPRSSLTVVIRRLHSLTPGRGGKTPR
jgi:hypothetical protein